MKVIYDTPDLGVPPFTPEYAENFKQWCQEHNAYYYGRPKAIFSERDARDLALEAGCRTLVLENLS